MDDIIVLTITIAFTFWNFMSKLFSIFNFWFEIHIKIVHYHFVHNLFINLMFYETIVKKLTRKSNPPEMSWKSPLYSADDELSFRSSDVTASGVPSCDVIVTLHFSCCSWRKRGISAQLDSMSTIYCDELRIRQNFSVRGKACSWRKW